MTFGQLLRPVAASLLLFGATSAFAQSGDREFLPLYQQSVTGNYVAGQQALSDLRTAEASRYLTAAAEAAWDDPILVERAFIGQAVDGQIGRAAATAKHLLTLDNANQLAQLVVAAEALKERRYSAASQRLAGMSQDSFTAITGTLMRAWALVGMDRADEADQLLVTLGETGLADFLVFHRALIAEASGDQDKAIRLAGEAYENEPYVARIVEVYARVLANAGQFDEAQQVIDAYFNQGLTHPVVRNVAEMIERGQRPGVFAANVQIGAAEMFHGIGVALARDGSRDLALIYLRLGLYLDSSADVLSLALGQLFDEAGRREAANEVYNAISATSEMKPTAVVRVAQNLDAMGEREEALRRLGNIVATNPEDLDAVSVLGDILRYDEQYSEAANAYTKALELSGGESPADWRFYYVRGIAHERNDNWQAAEDDFLKALELNPDQPQVLNYLGYSWVDMGMHLNRALGMIETAVAAQPRDGYIVDSLGWAFYRLGRIEEAVATLERAVQLMPNDPEINDHLGDAYWKAGRRDEARFQWNIAASVDEEGNVSERVAPKLENGLTEETSTDPVAEEDDEPLPEV
ncbi:tetratricopeptide repeat protein [Devosia pacifica]|nr:tetratricopeptide repeat protein [Devosia pacifica]